MRSTLLLNASFEPLRVIPLHRAVVLVLADKADVIAETDEPIRSPSIQLAAPSVIRLRHYVKVPYRSTLSLTRKNLIARDKGRCAYCGGKGDTIDHVTPRAKGGPHRWENVVAACGPCNRRKADLTLDELGWTLGFTPRAPRGWSWLVVGVAVRPEWAEWLPTAPVG